MSIILQILRLSPTNLRKFAMPNKKRSPQTLMPFGAKMNSFNSLKKGAVSRAL
jgi:hypothetical protein